MHEFEIIKKYFSKLSLDNKNSLKLNDDVFFDKSKELVISVDTYIDKSHFFDFKDPDLVIKKILRSSNSFKFFDLLIFVIDSSAIKSILSFISSLIENMIKKQVSFLLYLPII